MRIFIVLLPFLLLVVSCNETNNAQNSIKKDSVAVNIIPDFFEYNKVLDSSALDIIFFPSKNYISAKSKISNRRLQYYRDLSAVTDSTKQDSILDDARQYFTNKLLNEIVPHWYGTIWDFDGYTNKPNSGMIACGYFVSTTLKHMGLNINRYKMAQQGGLNEAKTLEPENDLLIYRVDYTEGIDAVCLKMKKDMSDGLYFVGLSNHVGYIYVKDNNLYFLHSNYIDGYVMIENAEFSEAFNSDIYVIADITHNDALMLKWINNTEFSVVQN